jgi:hypothetical protein
MNWMHRGVDGEPPIPCEHPDPDRGGGAMNPDEEALAIVHPRKAHGTMTDTTIANLHDEIRQRDAEIARLRKIEDAARALMAYAESGAPDYLDWDARYDAISLLLTPLGEEGR